MLPCQPAGRLNASAAYSFPCPRTWPGISSSQEPTMHKVLTSLLLGSIGLLAGCQDKQPGISKHELQNRLTQLESRALDSLVFIEGGTFIMGDFGAVGEDGVWRPYFPPTAERNTSHEVTLSSYSMSQ